MARRSCPASGGFRTSGGTAALPHNTISVTGKYSRGSRNCKSDIPVRAHTVSLSRCNFLGRHQIIQKIEDTEAETVDSAVAAGAVWALEAVGASVLHTPPTPSAQSPLQPPTPTVNMPALPLSNSSKSSLLSSSYTSLGTIHKL
jgi:hypothetical protein